MSQKILDTFSLKAEMEFTKFKWCHIRKQIEEAHTVIIYKHIQFNKQIEEAHTVIIYLLSMFIIRFSKFSNLSLLENISVHENKINFFKYIN